jgi:Cu-Zn family superoxide dismutase
MEKDGKMVPGLAAGGHFDPEHTDVHKGPYGNGHLGDLPALFVDTSGQADHPVLAPRLQLKDLKGHALVIQAGGDNYSDNPKALGGGGARIACGVVESRFAERESTPLAINTMSFVINGPSASSVEKYA